MKEAGEVEYKKSSYMDSVNNVVGLKYTDNEDEDKLQTDMMEAEKDGDIVAGVGMPCTKCAWAEIPTITAEVPIITAEVIIITAEEIIITAEVPSATAEIASVTVEVTSVTAEVPPIIAEVPAITGEEPIVAAEVATVTADLPAITTEVPPVTAEVPFVAVEVPPIISKPPPITARAKDSQLIKIESETPNEGANQTKKTKKCPRHHKRKNKKFEEVTRQNEHPSLQRTVSPPKGKDTHGVILVIPKDEVRDEDAAVTSILKEDAIVNPPDEIKNFFPRHSL